MNDFISYVNKCNDAGVWFGNVKNIAAHWLYGTEPNTLAKLSQQGIVYNPPGH